VLTAGPALLAGKRLFAPPRHAVFGLLAPRRARIAHRHRHGRAHCPSARMSERLRRRALVAGRYRCVYGIGCWGAFQADHYVPWRLGGFTALFNLMCLCAHHNRVKSDYWPREGYHPFEGADNITLAHAIWEAERRARRNPLHWALVIVVALLVP
jgi:hypothetical protein